MESLRQPKTISRISDLVDGNFIKKEGLEPSYVLTGLGQKVPRANIFGVIVDKFMSENGNYSSMTIDDDGGSIRLKAFGDDVNKFENFIEGDQVLVIGKTREYGGEIYILPEIIKKIDNPNYEVMHKLRIIKNLKQLKEVTEIVKKEKESFSDFEELKKVMGKKYKIDTKLLEGIFESLNVEEEIKEKDHKPLILEVLEKIDEGEGVKMIDLLDESKLKESIFQEVINELLSEGICYEPSPGVIKKV